MRHFWVFEALLDLRQHAIENGFLRLAHAMQEAIRVAHAEIDPTDPRSAGPSEPPRQRQD
jgi:hypothetical protein